MDINTVPDASTFRRTTLNPIQEASAQHAANVSKQLGISYEEAYERVTAVIEKEKVEPVVEHYHRLSCGDKEVRFVTLTEYIRLAEDKILAPTFTQYYTEEQKPAMLVGYVSTSLALRKKAKSAMFTAFAEGDEATGTRLDYTQANYKSKSNDISGLFRSKWSAIYSPSCHTTLTSLSRIVTSTNNTSSERLLQGRRHYHTYDITINNLNSIVANLRVTGRMEWDATIRDYGIHIPTVTDCLDMVKRSTKLYWYDPRQMLSIVKYLKLLDTVERCAICYSGDFYHFRKHNSEIAHGYLSEFTQKKSGVTEYTVDCLRSMDDDLLNYIHHRFCHDIKDMGVKYETYPPKLVSDMCRTGLHVQSVLYKYIKLIMCLFIHENLPPVVYDIYHMVRDSVLMSDTDSGANTLQEWVEWYSGNMLITEDNIAVSNALVYLNGVVVKTYIKQIGININISHARLNVDIMQLKNEFTWLVFGLMSISKHYFAGINIREGSVFDRKLEVKGGSLKSNSIPMSVKKDVVYDKLMNYILDKMETVGKISLYTCIDIVIQLEQDITNDVYSGGHKYVRKLTIQEGTAYKITDIKKNSCQHATMWNDVFGKSTKYTATPPYLTYKYNTTLKSATKIRAWIDTIDDSDIRGAMMGWVVSHSKTAWNIFYLPAEYVDSYGVPDALRSAINTRKIVTDLANMAYITLESLGYYKPLDLSLSEVFPDRVALCNITTRQ